MPIVLIMLLLAACNGADDEVMTEAQIPVKTPAYVLPEPPADGQYLYPGQQMADALLLLGEPDKTFTDEAGRAVWHYIAFERVAGYAPLQPNWNPNIPPLEIADGTQTGALTVKFNADNTVRDYTFVDR